ncbi:MAG: hypothetical protein ACK5LV_04705 [Lachnospirales bacterium]
MNTKKIILMSQLAMYEKKYGKKDFKKANYFKTDYVYIRNMWLRLFVIIGIFIVLAMYLFYKLELEGLGGVITFLSEDYAKILICGIIVVLVYTVYGTIAYGHEYNQSKSRLESYARLLNKVNKLENVQKKENVENIVKTDATENIRNNVNKRQGNN